MIRYAVVCHKGHAFDGWFGSSDAFDRQAKRGLITCPKCSSTKISKGLMAPAISTKTRNKGSKAPVATSTSEIAHNQTNTHVATQSAAAAVPAEMLDLMRKVRKEVEAKADYVGPRFADEARKIHHEEAPSRGIYGEASIEDVKALHEEGVECFPLPTLPEDHN
ncbi:MAG: DUF1178 family protein [Hyphomicrobiaceae bacterium]|nr:DUF1178 family protein [Hyphomicrobiaceae bacterium]